VLAAAVTAFVAAVYGLGADNLVFASYDYREISVYHKAYYRDAVRAGRLPLWNPHTFGGWPFAANPLTQTFYPFAFLSVVLPSAHAVIVDLILHLWLAALGTYILLRWSFGLSRGGATFGGLVFALSGSFVGHAHAGHPHYVAACAYVPWLWLAADRAVAQLAGAPLRRWPWAPGIWAGGLVVALQITSGGTPFVWLSGLFLGAYWLIDCAWRVRRTPRDCGRPAAALAGIAIAGALAGAVQLLPGYELMQLSNRRSTDYAYAAFGSYPPVLLRAMVFAGAWPAELQYGWEYYGYAGVLPVLLAAPALVVARHRRAVVCLAALLVPVVLFMFGEHGFLFPLLWRYVPGFDLFRVPARALIVLDFVLALLAAVGLDALGRRFGRRPARRRWLAVAAAGLTVVDVTAWARANRERLFLPERGGLANPTHVELTRLLRDDHSWYRYWFHRRLFRQNHAFAVGARSVGGYDTMYLQRYSRFVHHMTDTAVVPSLVTILTQKTFANAPSAFPFKILGVKYASYQGRIHQRGEVRRAWFVTRARRVADEDAALAYLRSDGFEPYGEVVFEAAEADALALAATPPGPDAAVEVTVIEYTPEHLRITLGPHPAGYLVLSEISYPGWRAVADGAPVPILRADSILRAVPVEAGVTTVEMTYAPRSVRVGAWLSGTACVAMGVVFARRAFVAGRAHA
jgi:hypothetical protein